MTEIGNRSELKKFRKYRRVTGMKGNIPAKPVEYNGVQYRSVGELARALGIWKTTLSYRLKHGLTPDKNHKKRPCCGMPSIREFARQTGQTANYIINVLHANYENQMGMCMYRNQREKVRYALVKIRKDGAITITNGQTENDKTDASRSRVLAFWVNGEKRAEYYRNKFKCDGILYVIDVADMRQILDCLHLDTSFFIRSWEWTVKNEEVYQEQLKVHLAEMAERRKRRAEERRKQREIEKEKERIKKQKQKEREKLRKQKQKETIKLKAKLKREKSKKKR